MTNADFLFIIPALILLLIFLVVIAIYGKYLLIAIGILMMLCGTWLGLLPIMLGLFWMVMTFPTRKQISSDT